jgi:cytochrome c
MVIARRRRGRRFVVWLGLLTACAPPETTPPPTSASSPVDPKPRLESFDVGPVRTAAEYAAEARFAGADLARGELLSLACAACHKLEAGAEPLIGPSLHGVFGRRAGAVAGFNYSAALKDSGLVWTPVSLEAWLSDPTGFVNGTTMAFTGYRSADDRRDLIAYLLQATQ